MAADLDLDVDSPGKVADVLRRAAEQYRESTSELQAAWQDESITVWDAVAGVLEKAADRVEEVVLKYFR